MSQFSDRPLVAGSVVGQRWFSVDRLGRLNSLNLPVPFRPGVNEAVCRKGHYNSGIVTFPWGAGGFFSVEEGAVVEPSDHQVASLGCTCGYYAFFDNDQEYNGVYGIIEGTGVCTVGTLGFRASHARLLAVVRPKGVDQSLWDRVLHNYPEVPSYAKKREAREAHPLTEVEYPTPETCENFWTRSP